MINQDDYSLATLNAQLAPFASQLINQLQQESDTFTIGSVRDGQDGIVESTDDSPAKTWLILKTEQPIGLASIEQGEIGLAILKKEQGQGIGQMVVRALIDWVQQVDLAYLWLDVQEHNVPAIHIYQKMGFEFTGASQQLTLPNQRQVVILRMELPLK
ncbi:GNAT family N-acetyltransferase [Convivina praedatoris]|uniref:N-acetyltransferase domain-containing protein n=1 Tax=Convivina praedatoris TaxID=2880963 RepID=A0ABM9D2D4_9LACO|nr:GNAT family N-acetyltransferase [Convivina sp. LMG 32447]CAH1854219.1 hypothetical protein R077815_00989 [Convivina sp. LMG 32447]CAH1855446.1 hypothetical protein R078138_01124 [Convivina sp. LMG 32447]CAH1855548.1 hypothetical protein LMG032447_01103 [Convivina sp. LMG 32447]